MSIKWLSNHWFLLVFVFASGGAAAWQEVQRQTISDVVIKQAEQAETQNKANEAIIRLEEQFKHQKVMQDSVNKKLEYLIKLQVENNNARISE